MSAVCTHTHTIQVTELPDEIAGCAPAAWRSGQRGCTCACA
jgi:hypothetical protein